MKIYPGELTLISLTVDRDRTDDDRATTPESLRSNSPAPSPPPPTQQPASNNATSPAPRRFISSILGGDVPYGSRRHVLTRAERKEYSSPPIASDDPPQFLSKSERIALPRPQTPPKAPRIEPPTRVSVIQRVPSQGQSASRKEGNKIEIERVDPVQAPEPEQVNYALREFTFTEWMNLVSSCWKSTFGETTNVSKVPTSRFFL